MGFRMRKSLHFVPGRLRVKLSYLKHKKRAADAQGYVAEIAGVTRVVANPVTGSLTIYFDRDRLPISDLWKILQAHGYAPSSCQDWAAVSRSSQGARSTGQFVNVAAAAIAESLVRHSAAALLHALL